MNLTHAGTLAGPSGTLDLAPLLTLLLQHDAALEILDPSTPLGRTYRIFSADLVGPVQEGTGFYLWGRYDERGQWNSIYLGKSGHGRASNLRARLLEELRDERCCLLPASIGQATIMDHGQRIYPDMWHRYRKHWERSLRKSGTTHIHWTSIDLEPALVPDVEAGLIQVFHPSANRNRPCPKVDCDHFVRTVEASMRSNIRLSAPTGELTST